MLIGRLLGWALVAVAVVMASADAVMALGPSDYTGIVAGDVLTLLTGGEMEFDDGARSFLSHVQEFLLDLPAWAAMGMMGGGVLWLSRPRFRRFRFRRA